MNNISYLNAATLAETLNEVDVNDIPTKTNNRSTLYKTSDILRNSNDGHFIEIQGHVGLQDKYHLWDVYGHPVRFLYLSLDDLDIYDSDTDSEIQWCIGWVSSDNTVFILADMLDKGLSHSIGIQNVTA